MATPEAPARERPWLLPYNRRLRHLQGLAIRNLTLALAPGRPRGKTTDDDALPSALTSPAKALAREAAVAHSRSSTDLRSIPDEDRFDGPPPSPRPVRPRRMRRRSTLEWANASPLTRQKRLEDITAGRMADTFFSLHVDGVPAPVYISEVAEKAMNPNFKFFDLGPCGPPVTRLDRLTVRVWAKSDHMQHWQFLLDYTVHLASLHFIGKTLGAFRHPLPQNCLLFHMTDGIYTSFVDLPVDAHGELFAPPKTNPDGRIATSSSYDALMRLSTLDDCIQDALITRDRIADEIEGILEANRAAMSTLTRVPEAEESLHTVQAAATAEHRRVLALRRRRTDLAASLQARRDKITAGRALTALIASELPTRRALTAETTSAIHTTRAAILAQRRRLCADLAAIYPLTPLPSPLAFTIRDLPLPPAPLDSTDPPATAAALGYAAHLLAALALYAAVLLPYPLTLCGSTSSIADPLALMSGAGPNMREFPLYSTGAVRFRFEYAVFLLGKNVQILTQALGVRGVGAGEVLGGLKLALLVAGGEGAVPVRRAGGIRGLLGWGRKGSIDSVVSRSSAGGGGGGGGGWGGEAEAETDADQDGASGALNGKTAAALPGSRLRPVE
ncbi:UV radiation resistance protein and autophagy-related subunit 14-domain-containing protein [Boeremia exigua]|uniref:UV radiation resistance protein and autophagy-related subunit 14-domain-containing protein n=1 Tax=Boeremia exigua TaxID=749465 RepID=UPI001E8E0FB3|nr:UV radiation resistance protein and autophagy-related subunit 14-domain-containing protein [Boeremia exigua]KAH6625517.1 UV radiation resistance protein and autophagy-related subunit 14-domain-containing protein [Boeremia exigua]